MSAAETCGCVLLGPRCGGHAFKDRLRDDKALSMAHLLNAQARALGLSERATEPVVTVVSDGKDGSSTMTRQWELEHDYEVRMGRESA